MTFWGSLWTPDHSQFFVLSTRHSALLWNSFQTQTSKAKALVLAHSLTHKVYTLTRLQLYSMCTRAHVYIETDTHVGVLGPAPKGQVLNFQEL